MQVYANQLDKHLQGALQPIYLVFGDDDFLRLQALGKIRQRAQQLGFSERLQLNQQQDFSWQELTQFTQNLSLFSERRLLELEMPTAAPGQEGSKALQAWVDDNAPDTVLVLHGPKLKADQQKSKWFKALTHQGVFIPVYSPERTQLPAFVNQLAQHYKLKPEPAAIELLSDWFEGNLLALDQALHKLALHHNISGAYAPLSVQDVRENADLQSRFDVFSLQDPLLRGDYKTYLSRLQRLLDTDGEPAIIHWLLQRECTVINSVYLLSQQGMPIAAALQKQGVWKSQQGAYAYAIKHWNAQRQEALNQLLWRVELAIKRDSKDDLATLFAHIGLCMTQLDSDLLTDYIGKVALDA